MPGTGMGLVLTKIDTLRSRAVVRVPPLSRYIAVLTLAFLGAVAGCSRATPQVQVRVAEVPYGLSVPAYRFLFARGGTEDEPMAPQPSLCSLDAGQASALAEVDRLVGKGVLGLALVEVDPWQIRVDGQEVAPLADGVLMDDGMRGQLVTQLYDALAPIQNTRHHAAEACGGPAVEDILVAVDPRVPYGTLSPILFTLGQARSWRFHFLVDAAQTKRPAEPPSWESTVSTLRLTEEGVVKHQAPARPAGRRTVPNTLPLERFEPPEGTGCLFLEPSKTLPTATLLAASSHFHSQGLSVLGISYASSNTGGVDAARTPVAARDIATDAMLSVVQLQIPRFPLPRTTSARPDCSNPPTFGFESARTE